MGTNLHRYASAQRACGIEAYPESDCPVRTDCARPAVQRTWVFLQETGCP